LEDDVNQKVSNINSLQNLNEVKLNDINEKSSKADQISFGIVNVVTDGINYLPSNTLVSDKKVSSPAIAYQQLLKLKPELTDSITCWGEYKDYYVFSIDLDGKENDCAFLSIYYIHANGNEFWYFYPNT
jgi:hypothetical protein